MVYQFPAHPRKFRHLNLERHPVFCRDHKNTKALKKLVFTFLFISFSLFSFLLFPCAYFHVFSSSLPSLSSHPRASCVYFCYLFFSPLSPSFAVSRARACWCTKETRRVLQTGMISRGTEKLMSFYWEPEPFFAVHRIMDANRM